jgi:hypothetical protein
MIDEEEENTKPTTPKTETGSNDVSSIPKEGGFA